MGYMFVMGQCFSCKRMFSFNADFVPSIRVDGVREPVCRTCIEIANPVREKNGLPKITINPEAYEPQECM